MKFTYKKNKTLILQNKILMIYMIKGEAALPKITDPTMMENVV